MKKCKCDSNAGAVYLDSKGWMCYPCFYAFIESEEFQKFFKGEDYV